MTGPSVSVSHSEAVILLKLQGTLRVDAATLLQQRLIDLAPLSDLTIDWEHAEYVDASVLQVLLSCQKAMKPECVLRVVSDSPKVRHYLELSGLSESFPCATPR